MFIQIQQQTWSPNHLIGLVPALSGEVSGQAVADNCQFGQTVTFNFWHYDV